MDQRNAGQPSKKGDGSDVASGIEDDIAAIREQTRETVALLRQLIEMLLPKGDPDAPKLEDLIAALIAQQRETLLRIKQIASDQSALIYHLVSEARPIANGHHSDSGNSRA
jgi:signal transduction histidine kinase